MIRSTIIALVIFRAHLAFPQDLTPKTTTESGLALFEEARMAVHTAQYEKADDLLRALIAAEPDMGIAYAYLSAVDRWLFRDSRANADSAWARVGNATPGERNMIRALTNFAEGSLSLCAEALIKELEANNADRFATHLLALVYIDLGALENAVPLLRDLLRDDPEFSPAWNQLSSAYLEQDLSVKARIAAERFLELMPANPSAYDAYADVLAQAGEVETALAHLRRAIELEPRMAFAWMHMGDIQASAGSPTEAARAYERAIETSRLYGPEFRDLVSGKLASL